MDTKTDTTTEHHARLLARLIRGLLADEEFTTLADLTDALKFRCARLHIVTTPEAISTAFRWVASNRVLTLPPVRGHFHGPATASGHHEPNRREAAAIMRRLLDEARSR